MSSCVRPFCSALHAGVPGLRGDAELPALVDAQPRRQQLQRLVVPQREPRRPREGRLLAPRRRAAENMGHSHCRPRLRVSFFETV